MSEVALIFPVERSRSSLIFPAFLLLSLFLHLFGFYLFQVVYRDPLHAAPQSASLTMLRPGNPEDAPILNWIEAEDPALAARPPSVALPGLLDVPYLPSYDESGVQPVLPEYPTTLPPLPSGRTFREIAIRPLLPAGPALTPIAAPPSRLVLNLELRERLPDLAPLPSSPLPSSLEPTRFLAGVTAQGRVAFLFLQNSSGDSDADTNARQYLRTLAFAPAPDRPLTWSPISYYWGASPPP